jgi:hypothetical protein
VLANRLLWQEIEASLAQRWARQVKTSKKIENLDLFGSVSAVIHLWVTGLDPVTQCRHFT